MKPRIRCSSLDRRLSCPGSDAIIKRLDSITVNFGDEMEGDDMTWRGNWCHYESAVRILGWAGVSRTMPAPVIPQGWTPNKWDRRTVERYVANVLARTPGHFRIDCERYFEWEFPRFILTGTIDNFSMDPEAIEFAINDLKTGKNQVDHASENWQLVGYLTLLYKHFPTLRKGKLRIFQDSSEWGISEHTVNEGELDSIVSFLETKLNEALDHMLLLRTSYKGCRLCPFALRAAYCPALWKEIMEMELSLEEYEKLQPHPTLKQLAEVSAKGRAVRGPIDKLLERLKDRVTSEGSITLDDGTIVSIKDTPGRREITDTPKAFERVAGYLGAEKTWDCTKISLSGVEDALVESGLQRTSRDPEKDTAEKWLKNNMSDITIRNPSKQLSFK